METNANALEIFGAELANNVLSEKANLRQAVSELQQAINDINYHLDNDKLRTINGLGEVQAKGNRVDAYCRGLYLANETFLSFRSATDEVTSDHV